MKTILEIQNLTKYYGNVLGVKDLSLSLEEGEIFGFIGPNGAGKSTTIRAIMNLINKNEGKILLNGVELTQNETKQKEFIGYLPSEVHLYDDLTVKEILDFHEKFYKKDVHTRRIELVERLKINEEKKIEELSLGNLKKLGIVLALIHSPKLLILDEPISGLDPIMQQVFYDLLLEEKKKGTTIFYSTHILSEISKVCDRVGIIKDGVLLNVETIKELKDKNFTFVTITSNDIDDIIKTLELKDYKRKEKTITFKNEMETNQFIRLLNSYSIDKILIEEPTLEDLFLHYYK